MTATDARPDSDAASRRSSSSPSATRSRRDVLVEVTHPRFPVRAGGQTTAASYGIDRGEDNLPSPRS